jgi:hypothetical protein
LVIAVFIAIVGVSAVFIPTLEVVSNQLMFFKKGTNIRKTFGKVEKSFGGAVPLTGEIVSSSICDVGSNGTLFDGSPIVDSHFLLVLTIEVACIGKI